MQSCDTLLMLGTGFPVPAVLSGRTRAIAQIDIRGENIGRRAPVDLGIVGEVARHARCAAAAARRSKTDRAHLDAAVTHYAQARKGLDELATGTAGRHADHPQHIARVLSELARRRCDLHLRCRAADGVGGALPGDERQAPAARLVLARLDGERDGAGDRRAGGLSRAAGGLAVGRRRLHHADGRPAQPRQLGLPAKVVVFNNGALGFIELEQKSTGFINTGTEPR